MKRPWSWMVCSRCSAPPISTLAPRRLMKNLIWWFTTNSLDMNWNAFSKRTCNIPVNTPCRTLRSVRSGNARPNGSCCHSDHNSSAVEGRLSGFLTNRSRCCLGATLPDKKPVYCGRSAFPARNAARQAASLIASRLVISHRTVESRDLLNLPSGLINLSSKSLWIVLLVTGALEGCEWGSIQYEPRTVALIDGGVPVEQSPSPLPSFG